MSAITPELKILLEANRILSSTLDIDALLKVVLGLAAEVVNAETGSLLLLDEKTDELVFNIALGDAGTQLKEIRLKLGEGIAGWVAKERQPLIVNDPSKDPRWTRRGDNKTKFVTRSILCVPLLLAGRLLGVVQAINKKQGEFSDTDLSLLEAFASQTAVAIENARLFSSLRAEKEKVETLFDRMIQGAVFSDELGQVKLLNPSARGLLNISENDKAANFWQKLETFQLKPALEELRNSSDDFISFEAQRAARQEGEISLFVAGTLKRLRDENGGISGMLLFLRDVSQEKKEEKLKRDFLSLMSHKLKTPLIAITGYTPLLLEEEDLMKGNPFLTKAVNAIHQQGLHLKSLVEKLIGFSLIEAENLTIEKKETALKTMIGNVLNTMRGLIENRNGSVVLSPNLDALPPLMLDPDKFKEVIKNLVENGLKFNKQEVKEVRIDAVIKDDTCVIAFQDNGTGIPRPEWEKIFNKFYQIEESFTGQIEGAGLGLALADRVVKAHGGHIQVASEIGVGSTLSVVIPIQ